MAVQLRPMIWLFESHAQGHRHHRVCLGWRWADKQADWLPIEMQVLRHGIFLDNPSSPSKPQAFATLWETQHRTTSPMSASFSFGSFGDIITTAQLVWRLARALSDSRGSAPEFRELVTELKLFYGALSQVRNMILRVPLISLKRRKMPTDIALTRS